MGLGVSECASLLKLSNTATRKLIEDGTLEAFKIAGEWRVSIDSFNRLGNEEKNNYKGSHGYADVPHPSKDSADLPNGPGVYFFWRHGKVIYVGQTKCLRLRINDHKAKSPFGLDKVSFLRVPIVDLQITEAYYIGICRPRMNRLKPHERLSC